MQQKVNTLLNEYYTYYRYCITEPYLFCELSPSPQLSHCNDCCAMLEETLLQLYRLFDNSASSSVINFIKKHNMCCKGNKVIGDAVVRATEMKYNVVADMINCIRFSLVATFTTQYNDDKSSLDALINILIYQTSFDNITKEKNEDEDIDIFLEKYHGNCDKVLIDSKLGKLIFAAFGKYKIYSAIRKMSYAGMVDAINNKIYAYKCSKENIRAF